MSILSDEIERRSKALKKPLLNYSILNFAYLFSLSGIQNNFCLKKLCNRIIYSIVDKKVCKYRISNIQFSSDSIILKCFEVSSIFSKKDFKLEDYLIYWTDNFSDVKELLNVNLFEYNL